MRQFQDSEKDTDFSIGIQERRNRHHCISREEETGDLTGKKRWKVEIRQYLRNSLFFIFMDMRAGSMVLDLGALKRSVLS